MSVGIFGVPLAKITNTTTGEVVGGTSVGEGGNTVAGGGVARGLLDQIFGENSDPTKNAISLSKIGKSEAQAMQTVNALRQAMSGGFISDADDFISLTSGSQFSSYVGSFHYPQIRDAIEYYYASVIHRERNIKSRNTSPADYVHDGGIKKGATCTISISNASIESSKSWITELKESRVARSSLVFDKFSVQSVNEPNEERYQIVQTFGADILYSFGRRPQMIILSGTVLNGKARVNVNGQEMSMDWKNALQRFYDKKARSTILTKNSIRRTIRIFLQDSIYEGYLLNLITNTNAANQSVSQVTMTLLVKRRSYLDENDSRIPPLLNEKRQAFGSKRVPREFISNPNGIDALYQENDRKIKQSVKKIEDRISDIIDAILRHVTFYGQNAKTKMTEYLERFVDIYVDGPNQDQLNRDGDGVINESVRNYWAPIFGTKIGPFFSIITKALAASEKYQYSDLISEVFDPVGSNSFSENVWRMVGLSKEIDELRSKYSSEYGRFEAKIKVHWFNGSELAPESSPILCDGIDDTGKTYSDLYKMVKKKDFSVTRPLDYSEEFSQNEDVFESYLSFKEPLSWEDCHKNLLNLAKDLFFNTGIVLEKNSEQSYFFTDSSKFYTCGAETLKLQLSTISDLVSKRDEAVEMYKKIQDKEKSFIDLKASVEESAILLDNFSKALINQQKSLKRWKKLT